MSTASRNCGPAGGTCGGGFTRPSAPGATGGTRGHYDPRASGKPRRPLGMSRKCLPRATNAAPPRKRAGAAAAGAIAPLPGRPVNRAHRAVFSPIGTRERPVRHSLPPPTARARRDWPRGRHPP